MKSTKFYDKSIFDYSFNYPHPLSGIFDNITDMVLIKLIKLSSFKFNYPTRMYKNIYTLW